MQRNFYQILGVSSDADSAEIKKACRQAAFDSHPDRHPLDLNAAARFREVSEAYVVLSDESGRRSYDRIGNTTIDDSLVRVAQEAMTRDLQESLDWNVGFGLVPQLTRTQVGYAALTTTAAGASLRPINLLHFEATDYISRHLSVDPTVLMGVYGAGAGIGLCALVGFVSTYNSFRYFIEDLKEKLF